MIDLIKKYSLPLGLISSILTSAAITSTIALSWRYYALRAFATNSIPLKSILSGATDLDAIRSILSSEELGAVASQISYMRPESVVLINSILSDSLAVRAANEILSNGRNIRMLNLLLKNKEGVALLNSALANFAGIDSKLVSTILKGKQKFINAFNKILGDPKIREGLAKILSDGQSIQAFEKILKNSSELSQLKDFVGNVNNQNFTVVKSLLQSHAGQVKQNAMFTEKGIIALSILLVVSLLLIVSLFVLVYRYRNQDQSTVEKDQQQVSKNKYLFGMVVLSAVTGFSIVGTATSIIITLPSMRNTQMIPNILGYNAKAVPIAITVLTCAIVLFAILATACIYFEHQKATQVTEPEAEEVDKNKEKKIAA